jgi:hypothetical protein
LIKTKQQTVDLLLLIFTVIVGIISYILNLGWIRLLLFLPFLVYNLIVLISGIIYVSKNCNEGKIKQRNVFYLSLLTYILFNVFFYDCADIGPSYCFFSLIKIHGDGFSFFITSMVSLVSLIISLRCIVLNIKAIINKKAMF